MAATPDKSLDVSYGSPRAEDGVSRGYSADTKSGSTAEMARDFEQLRDRFRRTTIALSSAAHDLKTPLAILNGYTELLQSEKLGLLNTRQREVLEDMSSNGQRLQHFIQ